MESEITDNGDLVVKWSNAERQELSVKIEDFIHFLEASSERLLTVGRGRMDPALIGRLKGVDQTPSYLTLNEKSSI